MKKLNILIITQGVSRIVEPLVCSEHNVVGILESAPRNFELNFEKKRSYILKEYLKMYFFDQTSLRLYSRQKNIPYRMMYSSNDIGLVDWLSELKLDLIVVFGMSRLLKENIIKIPRLGAINLHPSALPAYRGPNPCFWQYHDQVMNPGVTVHYIDEGEDTGDIIDIATTTIELGIKSPERLDKLIGEHGVNILKKAINNISLGKVSRKPQALNDKAPRARNLLESEHKSIIDWERWTDEHIWHLLRGTESWLNALPPPKGIYCGHRWIIGELVIDDFVGEIGKLYYKNNKPIIKTKSGYIKLECKFSFIIFAKKLINKFLRLLNYDK